MSNFFFIPANLPSFTEISFYYNFIVWQNPKETYSKEIYSLIKHIYTLYVSRTFSQFSFNCSISSFRSSISFCAMSHFCSVVSRREVLMLLVLDLDRFLPTPRPTSCCDPDWATPLDIPALGRPKVSFGSFLLRYFSNIWVSVCKTSFSFLKQINYRYLLDWSHFQV